MQFWEKFSVSLTITEVKKVAHLARLELEEAEISQYSQELSNILDLVAQMDAVDTTAIQPMAHPLNVQQPQRKDLVTETNQRELFQSIAPATEAGLYLVPKVIE